MRVAAVLTSAVLLLAAAGCSATSGEDLSAEGGDRDEDDDSGDGAGGGDAPAAAECDLASECVQAGSTCCECPAFAVTVSSGYEEACSEVACDPEPTGCAATEPACVEGRCQLVCSPLVTEMACENGFARDDFGCLLDACDPGGEAPECEEDGDCVQVPADCCGCARGGADTAVPSGSEAEYQEGLDCPTDASCPDVYVCDAGSLPSCIAGRCQLVSPPSGDDGAPSILCGTADSAPCPDGSVCVLNHPDASDATQVGAGSCQNP